MKGITIVLSEHYLTPSDRRTLINEERRQSEKKHALT